MRALMLALLLAAGMALIGTTSSVSAAPANGVTINDQANSNNAVVQVQHWRWRSGRHWRGGGRCHYRRWSRWGWC